MNTLFLKGCGLKNFNPDQLPKSIIFLDLSSNQIQTFDLNKELVLLAILNLKENSLTRFVLDLAKLLPKIITVNLRDNAIRDLKIIEDKLSHTLSELKLDGNQIGNIDAYEWIYQNKTLITLENNFPVCDCSSEKLLRELYERNYVTFCSLLLPVDVRVRIDMFKCPENDSMAVFTGMLIIFSCFLLNFFLTS